MDIYIVHLDSFVDQFLQLCFLHVLLLNSHHQLEPVDVYILHLGCSRDRFLQLRLPHVLLPSNIIKSEFVEYLEQLADGKSIRSCFPSHFVECHHHALFSDARAEHTGVLYDNLDLQSICDDIGLIDQCRK